MTISFDAWKEGHVAPTTHSCELQIPKKLKLEPLSPRFVKTLVHPQRTASIASVHFLDNGSKLVASGYPSGVVQVFDLKTGKELRRIETPPGYRGTAQYAVFTPDFGTLYVPVEGRKSTTFFKDGKKHYRHEYNGELRAWDLKSGEPLASLPTSAPGRGVEEARMSPVGDRLVTVERRSFESPAVGSINETLLWDLPSQTAKSLGKAYANAAFSHDGRRLATALFSNEIEPSTLTVINLKTGQQLFMKTSPVKDRGFSWPCFSPDGKFLAVYEGAGRINQPETIHFYDAETGKELGNIKSQGSYPFMPAAFSPDGKRVAASDYEGNVTIFDVSRMQIERTHSLGGLKPGRYVAFSPDSKQLVATARPKVDRLDLDPDPADTPQTSLFLFDLDRGGEPEILFCPQGYCEGLEFSPDGNLLAVGGTGGVHLFDVSKK